jgi:outer membrane protein assembly factor BamB
MIPPRHSPVLITLFAVAAAFAAARAEPNWPRLGGPEGTGLSSETSLPTKWDATAVAWKTTLRGTGQSSVIAWGDRLFVTSASPDGTKRWVHGLDRRTGAQVWEREIQVTNPEEVHKMNTWATPTCVTDGERVIAFFGTGGLHCFGLDGSPKWSRDLGRFPGPWGTAASPIIEGDLVIQNCDAEGPCAIAAFDRRTGEPVWSTPRRSVERGGWSTPLVISAASRREVILNGQFGVNAYDPTTGRELWFCRGFAGRGEPTPAFARGLLFVINGLAGNTYAVRPGGSGDVTATHRVWDARRQGGRDQPSPAVVGEFVLIASMSGVLTTYEAGSGRILFTDRLGSAVAATPLVAGGLVYFQMESGEVVVVKPGPALEVVARNPCGAAESEIFRAALAPIQGRLFARSRTTVYCIAPK